MLNHVRFRLWHSGPVNLPEWLAAWCRTHLGAVPADVLMRFEHTSDVFGLRLADGREVVVKSRPDQNGRTATCVEVQRVLAGRGFPCPPPLTGVTVHDGRAVHAERWQPGGEVRRGDDPATARLFGGLLARMVDLAADIEVGGTSPGAVTAPLPNPEWVRWDHDDDGPWPAIPDRDGKAAGVTLPEPILDTATRLRERLSAAYLPRVLGHADWESQNLRWHGGQPWAVHDWDSLAWMPEAAIAGSAAGAFASAAQPTLAPVPSSAAFLEAYQEVRGPFDDQEIEVAWAASLWLAVHNARGEAVFGWPPVAIAAVREQAAERLRLAGA
jgi:Ser/Thr protein kinase RdoA (MazF antagonist)